MSHPLIAQLGSRDPTERREACLAASGDPSATLLTDALCEALGDPVKAVVRAASDALVSIAREVGDIDEPLRRACCACCWADPCLLWGDHARANRDPEGAVLAYGRGCDMGDNWACVKLGETLRAEGRLEEAVAAFARACRALDDDSCIRQADVLDDLGRRDEARKVRSRIPGFGYE